MIKLLIVGANGKMGKKVRENALSFPEIKVVGGVDVKENLSDAEFPIFDCFNKLSVKPDVIVDFSSPLSLDGILDYALKTSTPAVLCATGYSEEQVEKVKSASKKVAIFRSANMSLGVNVIIDLVKKAASTLYGFDSEIIEMHHNEKKDAPSGTALMLANAIKEVCPEKFYVYGRNGLVGKRNENEIGIHALRGGNVVGNHEVIFAGNSETVTISHQATDRAIFAVGALKAAIYISKKEKGLFNMSDMINGK